MGFQLPFSMERQDAECHPVTPSSLMFSAQGQEHKINAKKMTVTSHCPRRSLPALLEEQQRVPCTRGGGSLQRTPQESLKGLVGAGRELDQWRKCTSPARPLSLLRGHRVGAPSPSQEQPLPWQSTDPVPGVQGTRHSSGTGSTEGRQSRVRAFLSLGRGAQASRGGGQSIPTDGCSLQHRRLPTSSPTFGRVGGPRLSPPGLRHPPLSLLRSGPPRAAAPSLLPGGAAAVPARSRREAAELGVRARPGGLGAAGGAARQPVGRGRFIPLPGGEESLELQVITAGGGREGNSKRGWGILKGLGERQEAWGWGRLGLCKAF